MKNARHAKKKKRAGRGLTRRVGFGGNRMSALSNSCGGSPDPVRWTSRQSLDRQAVIWIAGVGLLGVLALRSAEEPAKAPVAADGAGSGALPVGCLVAFAGPAARVAEGQGWMLCDGRELMARDFPALQAAIGEVWGGDEGSGTFRLPDLRGRFLRGANLLASGPMRDPDAGSRMAVAAGGAVGDEVGSLQGDLAGPHTHPLAGVADAIATGSEAGWVRFFGTKLPDETAPVVHHPGVVQPGEGAETRPVNVSVNWLIRVR